MIPLQVLVYCIALVPLQARHEAELHNIPVPLHVTARGQDWPCFMGPTHDGKSRERNLNKEWGEDGPPLVWSLEIGEGYAAPSVADSRVVMTHRLDDFEIVDCLESTTGRRVWRHAYRTDITDRYGYGKGPRSTPVIHEGKVYTLGIQGWLKCLRLDNGDTVWSRNVVDDFGTSPGFFGIGTSPLIDGDYLIVNVGAADGGSVIAFDKSTGRTAWRCGSNWGASYASPVPADFGENHRICVFAGGDDRPPTGGLLVIDPAKGAVDARFPFRSSKYESVNAASPVIVGDRVFISTSYDTGGVMLALPELNKASRTTKNADGSVHVETSGERTMLPVWKSDSLEAHFGTPILVDGYLYGFDGMSKNDTALVCVDAQTGEQKWRKAIEWNETLTQRGKSVETQMGVMRGSLILADGAFLCLGEQGHLLWLDLSPSGAKVLARSRLFYAQETWTGPVLSQGLLYVTQNRPDVVHDKPRRLLCYSLRSAKNSRRSRD